MDMPPEAHVFGRWSPDGRRLAFEAFFYGRVPELYLVNADGSGLMQITNMSSNVPEFIFGEMVWSPDQKWLALTLLDKEDPNIRHLYLFSLDDKELIDMNVSWDNTEWPVWSPDSNEIAFTSNINDGQKYLFAISITTRKIRQLTSSDDWKDYLSWQ
jgi:Tol biopolymer transport system component